MRKRIISGVLGLAVNAENRFLLTLRKDNFKKMDNKWEIPGGGIEFGETPQETLVREMREEVGVSPTLRFPYPIAKRHVWNTPKSNAHINLLCYIVDIGEQTIHVDGEECVDFRWFQLNEVENLETLPLVTDFVHETYQILTHNGAKLC